MGIGISYKISVWMWMLRVNNEVICYIDFIRGMECEDFKGKAIFYYSFTFLKDI